MMIVYDDEDEEDNESIAENDELSIIIDIIDCLR